MKRTQDVIETENTDAGPKKWKRGDERPLLSRENVAGVMDKEVDGIGTMRGKGDDRLENGQAVKTKEQKTGSAEERKWWEGDDIDQDLLRELGPYVEFV